MQVSELLTRNNRHTTVEPSTKAWRERCYRQFCQATPVGEKSLLGSVGDCPAEKIIGADLTGLLFAKTAWSPNQKWLFAKTIKEAFQWAVAEGLIQANPFAAIRYPQGDHRRPWTLYEFNRAVDKAPLVLSRLIRFLRWTGCRPGEAISLRWGDLDFAAQTAKLATHKTFKKTKRPRQIALIGFAMEVLEEIGRERIARRAPIEDNLGDLVFTRQQGSPWDRAGLSQRMGCLRVKTGLSTECKLHGLRHYFASDAIRKGVPVWIVSKALGHSSIETTIRCYVKIEDDPQEWITSLERHLR